MSNDYTFRDLPNEVKNYFLPYILQVNFKKSELFKLYIDDLNFRPFILIKDMNVMINRQKDLYFTDNAYDFIPEMESYYWKQLEELLLNNKMSINHLLVNSFPVSSRRLQNFCKSIEWTNIKLFEYNTHPKRDIQYKFCFDFCDAYVDKEELYYLLENIKGDYPPNIQILFKFEIRNDHDISLFYEIHDFIIHLFGDLCFDNIKFEIGFSFYYFIQPRFNHTPIATFQQFANQFHKYENDTSCKILLLLVMSSLDEQSDLVMIERANPLRAFLNRFETKSFCFICDEISGPFLDFVNDISLHFDNLEELHLNSDISYFTEYFKDISRLKNLKTIDIGLNFNDKFSNLSEVKFPNTIKELQFTHLCEKSSLFCIKDISNIEKLVIRAGDDTVDFEYYNSLNFTNIQKIEFVLNNYDIESISILNFNKISHTLKEIKIDAVSGYITKPVFFPDLEYGNIIGIYTNKAITGKNFMYNPGRGFNKESPRQITADEIIKMDT